MLRHKPNDSNQITKLNNLLDIYTNDKTTFKSSFVNESISKQLRFDTEANPSIILSTIFDKNDDIKN